MEPTPYDDARRDAIAWLMGRVNYERTQPIPYAEQSLKLDRVRELLRRLGDPQDRLRLVHIAGTKGKGSTAAMIAAACQEAGMATGVYSSPHLERLEERFAIDGAPCSADELVALVDAVRPIAEAMDTRDAGPTYFDLTTAMALEHFARRGVDAAVVEVGLGGRLDSTNAIRPDVAAVTSISLDHTRQLGATRAAIAAEKAGIFKPGVPAVSGVADDEAGAVIRRVAAEVGCPLYERGRDFEIAPAGGAWRFQSHRLGTIDQVRPALPGAAQAANAAVALAVLAVLAQRGWPLPADARRRGVGRGKLPARMERFAGEPLVVVDGAHNDASAQALAEVIDQLCGEAPRERRVLVVAISSDKDSGAILEPLARRFAQVVCTRFLENPRAAPPEQLAEASRGVAPGTPVALAATPEEAYRLACATAGERGAVVFAGSLLFAAEARRLVVAERGEPPA
ncbi:folylpolyglutamate synthase/dihydrofolate synthase family protein [Botrimarina sp.]|uniref:bifunctional folylpolyglutamate synthase/dihydrofolate synthase n=1 Tax=Botrimarina sp. TaxID=2795802 RepID=UPI0032EC3D9F